VCGGAIQSGRLDVLKWLREEQQCTWNSYAGSAAVLANQLPVLQYIYGKHDGGMPLFNDFPPYQQLQFSLDAVLTNNLELLDWCYSQDLLLDNPDPHNGLHVTATASDCYAAAEWLQQHGFNAEAELDRDTEDAMNAIVDAINDPNFMEGPMHFMQFVTAHDNAMTSISSGTTY
jgi:hypothetical protein